MKKIFLLLLASSFASLCYSSGVNDTIIDPVKAEKAKSIVQQYIRLWNKGAADSVAALCTVPFAWDRKAVISDADELKSKMIETRGEKENLASFELDTIYVKKARREILDVVLPLDVYYVVIIFSMNGSKHKKGALFAVQMTPEPKIAGISD